MSGYPTSTNIPQVDGLSTDTLVLGCHSLVSELRYTNTLGAWVWVSISLVLIPASQFGIRAKVNDYLGSTMGVERR